MTKFSQDYEKIAIFVGPKIGPKLLEVFLQTTSHVELYISVSHKSDLAKIRDTIQQFPHIKVFFKSILDLKNLILEEKVSPRWLLNLWGSEIFDSNLINRSNNSLNVHPSLLPWGKGRDPVFWNVLNGEPAGATLHSITKVIDSGPIYVQREVPYDLTMSSELVYATVIKTCIELFREYWPLIYAGDISPKPQQKLDTKIKKRSDLQDAVITDLNKNNDGKIIGFIRWIQACDFGANYVGQILISDVIYETRITMKKIN